MVSGSDDIGEGDSTNEHGRMCWRKFEDVSRR